MTYKFDFKKMWPLLAVLAAAVVAIPLRVAQYIKYIDASTGFFNEINASVIIFYVLVAAAAVIGFAMPLIRRKDLKPAPIAFKSVQFTVVSLIMAVTLIVDSAVQLMNYFDLVSLGSIQAAGSIKEYLSAQGATLLLLQALSGAATAVYFFVSGVTVGLGNADISKYKVISLVPVLWCIFRLLYRFKRTISFVNVSDLLLELFMIVFSMMFFFAVAQINSKIDINEKGSELINSLFWKVFSYGIPAAVFAVVCFIPRFVLLLTGNKEFINTHYPVCFGDIGFIVYAVFTCITALKANTGADDE